jgi:NADPH-dependent stearoyl-CoA 9-desaturase
MNPTHVAEKTMLSAEELEGFAAELDAIGRRVREEVGESDARYLRRVVALQRSAEIGGRAMLFAGAIPPLWAAGVALLGLSKILENMEIGHNVIHGQYDWMNDPVLNSDRYEWDLVCPAEHWKKTHNYEHHTFTSVLGKDRDVGYGFLRVTEDQPWRPANLGQPLYALGLMFVFEWGIALHNLEFERVLAGEKSPRVMLQQSLPIVRKATRQMLKDYVFFPIIAGPSAPFVFAGNAAANVVRNVWAFLIIFCGHFPEGVAFMSESSVDAADPETRGAWYQRQVRGSANIEGPPWFHVLSGNLSHQIEHHLFPDLPSCRYAQIAALVEPACRRYGIPYTTGSFVRQVGSVARRLARLALPHRLSSTGVPRPVGRRAPDTQSHSRRGPTPKLPRSDSRKHQRDVERPTNALDE